MRRFTTQSNEEGGEPGESYWFWCPGCDTNHRFVTKLPTGETGPVWSFDGNLEKPTFSPSLDCNRGHADPARGVHRCHLFLKAGMVQYLGDCTHEYAGKTIPVQDDEWESADGPAEPE
jgi:hypothetical protein